MYSRHKYLLFIININIIFLLLTNKMKNEKYHTVGKIPNPISNS